MLLRQILSTDRIFTLARAEAAPQIIAKLSKTVARALSADAGVIEQAVLEREHARTTALPNGAAIPHCRLSTLPRFAMAMTLLHDPVTWHHVRVDTVVLIAGPTSDVSGHLRILANTSQLLDSQAIRAKLKCAPNPEAAYELISAAEDAIERRRAEEGILREIRKEQNKCEASDWLSAVAKQFDW